MTHDLDPLLWLDGFDYLPLSRINWEAVSFGHRYYLDTEFLENGPGEPLHLLSIGLIDDSGVREYYAVNADCPLERANDWVREHVIPHLGLHRSLWTPLAQIRDAVTNFCDVARYGSPEFWGYYADYDWVVFCQIFGRMIDLPKGFPMYCRDLKQWCDQLGNPQLPEQKSTEHHALNDARWNREVFYFLSTLEREHAHAHFMPR